MTLHFEILLLLSGITILLGRYESGVSADRTVVDLVGIFDTKDRNGSEALGRLGHLGHHHIGLNSNERGRTQRKQLH